MPALYEAGAIVGSKVQITEVLTGGGIQTYKYMYDFAVDGGAQGTLVLRQNNGALPSGFIIQNAFIDVTTQLNSGGSATAALATPQSANDLITATAFGSAPWSSTGRKLCIPVMATASTWLKMTQARSPTLVIATADLTGGVFNLYVQGVAA